MGGFLGKAFSLARGIKLVKNLIVRIRKGPDEVARLDNKRRFAAHLVSDLQTLTREAHWQDDGTYSEIDVEVIQVGRGRPNVGRNGWRRFRGNRRSGTLVDFLERSSESMYVIHGEPGTGKSMALRHLALA